MSAGLTDFLLARIAEDEHRASNGAQGTRTSSDGWHTVECGTALGYWASGECTCRYVDRVLAECDAKRRIVENGRGYRDGESGFGASQYAMQCLALAYTDHPDYRRDEWRP